MTVVREFGQNLSMHICYKMMMMIMTTITIMMLKMKKSTTIMRICSKTHWQAQEPEIVCPLVHHPGDDSDDVDSDDGDDGDGNDDDNDE